jgi:Carbohydrate binding module (family 6)/PLD-like domain
MRTRAVGLTLLLFIVAPSPARAADPVDILCDTRYQDCRAPLLARINAEPTGGGIDVAFWFMEDSYYANALVNARNRGVRVRVLVDERANDAKRLNEQILNTLQTGGVPMRTKVAKNWSDILHWKMMYFETQKVVQFSAANYTPYSFVPATPYQNYIDEVVYFTDDPRLTASFNTKFEDYWTDQTGNFRDYANVSGPQSRVYPISPRDPALNFVPHQDYAVRAIADYNKEVGLAGAKIDVIMFRHSDRRHADAIVSLFKKGVPVRLITEQDNYRHPSYLWHSHNTDLVWAAGIPVKDRNHSGSTHQKSVILYGQKEVIFGSSNWSTASANQQLEHNIFSRPCTSGQTTWCDGGPKGANWFFNWFVQQFESKWNSSEFKNFIPLPGGTPTNSAPSNGATASSTVGLVLKWDGGNWNHKYDVYLGRTATLTAADKIATDIIVGSPYTGDLESWTVPFTLAAGTTYYWRVVGKTMAEGPRAAAAGLNLSKPGPVWSFTTAGGSTGGGVLTPFGGTPTALPGSIQAENFDEGGSSVAYVDGTAGNTGGVYRTTDVDIGLLAGGGGNYVGWTRPGEWLKYTVNVATAGTYALSVRVGNKGTGATFHVEVDGVNKTGTMVVPDTGDWQAWQTLSKTGISLTAGTHVVRLVLDTGTTQNGGVGNFDDLRFTAAAAPTATPYGGTAAALPGTLQAENFDEGGPNVAYRDTTAGNAGNLYRTSDVDVGLVTGGGNHYVGWTRPGEWLQYTVNVTAAGTYALDLRVANKGTGATLHVEVDGADRTGPMAVPDTGDWQAWQTMSVSGISLTAGSHRVRLVLDAGTAQNGGVGNVDYLRVR